MHRVRGSTDLVRLASMWADMTLVGGKQDGIASAKAVQIAYEADPGCQIGGAWRLRGEAQSRSSGSQVHPTIPCCSSRVSFFWYAALPASLPAEHLRGPGPSTARVYIDTGPRSPTEERNRGPSLKSPSELYLSRPTGEDDAGPIPMLF